VEKRILFAFLTVCLLKSAHLEKLEVVPPFKLTLIQEPVPALEAPEEVLSLFSDSPMSCVWFAEAFSLQVSVSFALLFWQGHLI